MEEVVKHLALNLGGIIVAIETLYVPIGYGSGLPDFHFGKSLQEYRRLRRSSSSNHKEPNKLFACATYPGYRFGRWLYDVTHKNPSNNSASRDAII
jgi:hypothetical protein